MKFNVVLVEPEIPQNTGNISRTCAATGCDLHLVRPLGFEITDRHLKRAGLDYWDKLNIFYYDSFEELLRKFPDRNFYFYTTKAQQNYAEVSYRDGDFLVFGKETKGLPEALIHEHYDTAARIPMFGQIRSLNLSNSVAIVVYEAFRQNDFGGLNEIGHLTDPQWGGSGK